MTFFSLNTYCLLNKIFSLNSQIKNTAMYKFFRNIGKDCNLSHYSYVNVRTEVLKSNFKGINNFLTLF